MTGWFREVLGEHVRLKLVNVLYVRVLTAE